MISKGARRAWTAALLLAGALLVAGPAPGAAAAGEDESIDSILSAAWQQQGVEPAPLCSDDQFLRRASLDIIGRIPRLDELRRFRRQPDRRAEIERLLASDEFARFWSEVWTAALNGYSNVFASDREVLRAWLENSFRRRLPYDQLVTRLLTSQGASALDGPANFLVRYPEQPAVKVSRMFLGVRLDCARCHDHPFDRWTQEDFARMNRFFEATRREEVSEGNVRLVNELGEAPPEDRPRFLSGARPRTTQWRDELALFIVRGKPFARAYANRMWYHFLGRGVVHPVDDFHRENPPAVPRLIEYLAEQARRDQFDVPAMIRRICNSRAYQLASAGPHGDAARQALFAQRLLKPLTPEQVFDSVAVALGHEPARLERREFIERSVGRSLDEDFSETWLYRETVQSLMSRLNANLRVPVKSPGELYLRILCRDPSPRELEICRQQAPADIVFALIHSHEFVFNH